MEATGHCWLSVYTFFLELGYNVKVINPIQSEAFRKMYIRQAKNDSKDSYIIAQIMRFGEYSATSLSEENIIALRQLSRYRLALVDACGDCKRRIIALLDQVFPEYDKLFSDTFGSSSTELLLNCPTPEDIITTITGIGDVLGAIIVSEIGDINRFKRPNQLVAFAGLDVTVKQSGEFSGSKKNSLSVVRLISEGLSGLLLIVLLSVTRFYPSIINLTKPEANTI